MSTPNYDTLRATLLKTRNELAVANTKDEGGILVIPGKDTWAMTQMMAENPWATAGVSAAVGAGVTVMGARGVLGEGVQNLILGK